TAYLASTPISEVVRLRTVSQYVKCAADVFCTATSHSTCFAVPTAIVVGTTVHTTFHATGHSCVNHVLEPDAGMVPVNWVPVFMTLLPKTCRSQLRMDEGRGSYPLPSPGRDKRNTVPHP